MQAWRTSFFKCYCRKSVRERRFRVNVAPRRCPNWGTLRSTLASLLSLQTRWPPLAFSLKIYEHHRVAFTFGILPSAPSIDSSCRLQGTDHVWDLQGSRRMFCGKRFFFGRPVFWFRKSSCFFSQKRVSCDAMFTSCFADWRLSEPLWNGVESPRHEVKNVIVKRNCAFEFFRQKCILHVLFFVCCHVCRVCVGSLLQSSFFRAHKSHFPKSETKIARKS